RLTCQRRRGAAVAATNARAAGATATDVTPSHTLVQELQLRASGSPVCQLQLIVSQRFMPALGRPFDTNSVAFAASSSALRATNSTYGFEPSRNSAGINALSNTSSRIASEMIGK